MQCGLAAKVHTSCKQLPTGWQVCCRRYERTRLDSSAPLLQHHAKPAPDTFLPKLINPQLLPSDNTNADRETRAYWVELARNVSVPIRCIYFSTPAKICRHNNAVRAANSTVVCDPALLSSPLSRSLRSLYSSKVLTTTQKKEKW